MFASNNGVNIYYEVHGAGRPVILLHGFPDSGRLWRHQTKALVDAGFQVIVPDLRGYGKSDQPRDVADYHLLNLAGDVTAILDAEGHEKVHVVGHDWGAALAWTFAAFLPARVDHLVVLSVGHPATVRGTPDDLDFDQIRRSWYFLLFEPEGIAEQWLTDNNWKYFRAFSEHPDADAVIASRRRDRSSGLNWYRSTVPAASWIEAPIEIPPVAAPTLAMWSDGDLFLNEAQMLRSEQAVTGPWRYVRIEGAGHHMQLEQPGRINQLLLEFLPS
jgi:pimeloyl-ACP methyl ester carboxylesterase